MEHKKIPTDEHIVALYWERSEQAITESATKYGNYCHSIAYSILSSREEADESVNDTWFDAWNQMPPHRPEILSTFLGKITRRISIDRWRKNRAEKRGGGELPLVLDELEDCISNGSETEIALERHEMERIMREFLHPLPKTERSIFLRRYWYMQPIAEIAAEFGFSVSKTTSMLHRTRAKLRKKLESEGYV